MVKKDNFVNLDFDALLTNLPKDGTSSAHKVKGKGNENLAERNAAKKKNPSKKAIKLEKVDAQYITAITTHSTPGKLTIEITYEEGAKLSDRPKTTSPMVKSVNLSLLHSLQEMLGHFS